MRDELPEGWIGVKLGDLIDGFETGRNLRAHGTPAQEGQFGVLKISAVTWGTFRADENKALLPGDVPKPHERILAGDVLISRANTSDLVGAVVLVGRDHRNLMLPDKILRLRVRNELVHRGFLVHSLRLGSVREYFAQNATGTSESMRNLSQPKLAATPLRLAPLAEQKRISELTDQLLVEGKRAGERLDRVTKLLKRFRQSVVAAACSGTLTESWRPVNAPGLAARHGASIAESESDLPEAWIWASTEELCDPKRPITYGVIKLGPPVPDGVPVLRSSDVRWLSIDEDGIKRIAPEIAGEYTRTFLRGGEVLVTVRGTLGGVAVVPPRMAGYNISREVAVLPLLSQSDPEYVALAVASMPTQNWLKENAKGAAYTGINIEDLRRVRIPIPPRDEQKEIVRIVRGLLALADTIERRVAAALAKAEKLPQAILAKAFSGELVPTEAELARAEGRPYESAEALLRRLAPSADSPAPKRPRKKKSG